MVSAGLSVPRKLREHGLGHHPHHPHHPRLTLHLRVMRVMRVMVRVGTPAIRRPSPPGVSADLMGVIADDHPTSGGVLPEALGEGEAIQADQQHSPDNHVC